MWHGLLFFAHHLGMSIYSTVSYIPGIYFCFLLSRSLFHSPMPPSTWLIYTKNSAWGSPSFRNPSPILHLSEFPPKVLHGTYFALASSAIHLCLLPDRVLLEARVPILSIASLVPKSTLDTADALNRLLRTVTPICT